MPFFDSRWIDQPEQVTEVPGGGLPQGFRAAGQAVQNANLRLGLDETAGLPR